MHTPTSDDDRDDRTPQEFAALDAALRRLRIEPRASLGPEIAGRAARGERARTGARALPGRRFLIAAGLAGIALLGTAAAARAGYVPFLDVFAATRTTELCCLDLDGVGGNDDGILVETVAGRRVQRLMLYEERDRDRAWTAGELVRFTRRRALSLDPKQDDGHLVTREFCCSDYDGGGDPDDGLIVVASAGGDVLLAALYDGPGFSTNNLLR
jgi:hypothetical protein